MRDNAQDVDTQTGRVQIVVPRVHAFVEVQIVQRINVDPPSRSGRIEFNRGMGRLGGACRNAYRPVRAERNGKNLVLLYDKNTGGVRSYELSSL